MGDRFSYPPLAVICWPFEAGTPDLGMGAGASLLAGDRELHDVLASCGWTPTLERIAASADPLAGEVTRIFDLLRAHALAVRAAVGRGAFPFVLSGGCISAAATVAGAGADGAVWFDAHADLDTPEDNLSGLDGRPGALDPDRQRVAGVGPRDPGLHARAGVGGAGRRRPRPRGVPTPTP